MAVDDAPPRAQVVFLLDVDNTLIDNDRAREALVLVTERLLGPGGSDAYWRTYEEVREDLGYVDSLETLVRHHAEYGDVTDGALDRAILDLPYARMRYPETLRVIAALRRTGLPVVLSDGDPVFQPLKIARAGITASLDANVLVFAHKDEHLDDVERLFPADRYVAVDDKAGILARVKQHWAERVITVHVLQGKYADDPFVGPPPDRVIRGIGELEPLVGTADALRVFLQGATIHGAGA